MNRIVGVMADHTPNIVERHCDVAVIGGSAAGLATALQLGRQRRSVIVVDAGEARNAPAAHMHGYLAREGVRPSELTTVGRGRSSQVAPASRKVVITRSWRWWGR